jgi:Rieske Fe-S protein
MGSIPVANPSPPQRLRFPRRGLRIVVLVATVVAALIVALSYAWPTGSKVDQVTWFTAGATSDFAVNEPVRFPDQRFWLVHLGSGEFIALWQRSPYLGCTIVWRPDFEFAGKRGWFRDPCHSDTFAVDGSHAFGPAPRSMDRFPVRFDDGIVRVNVNTVIQGPGGPAE